MLEHEVDASERPRDDYVGALNHDGQNRRRVCDGPGDDLRAGVGIVAKVNRGIGQRAGAIATIGHRHTRAS